MIPLRPGRLLFVGEVGEVNSGDFEKIEASPLTVTLQMKFPAEFVTNALPW